MMARFRTRKALAVLVACAVCVALVGVGVAVAANLGVLGTADDASTASEAADTAATSEASTASDAEASDANSDADDDSAAASAAAASTGSGTATASDDGGTAYAVYSSSDNSLTFSYATSAPSGTAVYSDVGATEYTTASDVPWNDYVASITTVVFDSSFASATPVYCRNWFANMTSCATFTDLKYLNTASVTDMYRMFTNCSAVTSLDLSDWDTSSVTSMRHMFYGCTALTSITFGESWSMASVTRTDYMFYDCQSLESLDVSGWSMASVTNMAYMFYDCYRLEALDVAKWDVSNVEKMMYAFSFCANVEELDLSGWKTTSLKYMYNLFYGCASLESISFSSDFTTEGVTDGYGLRSVFSYCLNLKTLDLSGWDTSGITNMSGMFNECWSLRTIYVSSSNWSTSAVTASDGMFTDCYSLVGGYGTKWDSKNEVDATYALIDSSSMPGYLTEGSGVASLTVDGTTTYYTTVQAAFTAAASASGTSVTVTLLADVDEDVSATSGTFTFDLNGYTLTNASGDTLTVAEGANLTVTDNYDYSSVSDSVSSPVTLVKDYADVAISIDITAVTSPWGMVTNEGSSKTYTLVSNGTLAITGGVFTSTTTGADTLFAEVPSTASIAVSGGWFSEQVPNAYCADGYAATPINEDSTSVYCDYYTVAEGTIYFWGGALRITIDESETSGYDTGSTDLRFAYSYTDIPEGATVTSVGWYWGTSETTVQNKTKSVASTNTRVAGSYTTDPTDAKGTVTHLVVSSIPMSSNYSTVIYEQMWITYTTSDDESVTIVDDIRCRSAEYIVDAIMAAVTQGGSGWSTTSAEYVFAAALNSRWGTSGSSS